MVLMAGSAQAQAPTVLPDAQQGQAYTTSLTGAFFVRDATFSTPGPAGLTLAPTFNGATLAGTPTTAGTTDFIVRFTSDNFGCSTPPCAPIITNVPFRLTVQPSAPASVPTLSEWAMILFGTVLACAAALKIQRRRQFG